MFVGALCAYGRRTYAACVGGPTVFVCSGVTPSTTINAANATVSTLSGFSITTGSATGLTITGDGALSYTDDYFSPITAATTGLSIGSLGSGTDSVIVDTNGAIQGGSFGITARNTVGGGAVVITANGDVTGTASRGIFALNFGTDLTVTTGAGATVTGSNYGIFGRSYGTGATVVTANGDVTATAQSGILARNAGTTLTVTTGTGTLVSGRYGIFARNDGSGALTITTSGDVTGSTDDGIYARHSTGGSIVITIEAGSDVTSNGANPDDFAVQTSSLGTTGPANLTVAGTLNGGGGGAVQFGDLADRLELHPTATINGNVLAGSGTDTFVLGGTGTGSFDVSQIGASAQYQSFEVFEKEDTSVWTLTGTNTVIANWAVNAGTLSVDGSMPNTAFTLNAGTLGGVGTVGSLDVLSGATVAPGDGDIGTLSATGNVSFAASSFYQVELNPSGQSDKVDAAGTATLAGGTVQVLAQSGSYSHTTTYTILTALGGVTGTFAGVTSNFAFLAPSLSYDANNVYLNLINTGVSFCSVADTRNQCDVATALDQFPIDNPLFLAVLGQTAAGARQAFDALSGEIHATVSGVLADDSRYVRDAINARLLQAFYVGGSSGQATLAAAGGPMTVADGADPFAAGRMALGAASHSGLSAPTYDTGLAFWTQGYGTWGDFAGNGNAASADRDLAGFISGADWALGRSWRGGLATGYAQSSLSVDARLSSANVESYHLAGYAGGPLGDFALRGGGVWTWSQIDTDRAVVFPGFFEREEASYDGDTVQLFAEAAWPFTASSAAMEPFGRLAYVHVDLGGFAESGGVAALSSSGNNVDVGYSVLGLRAATVLHGSGLQVIPHASLSWQHAFANVEPASALAFVSPSVGFIVFGVPLADDSALIEAGLDFRLAPDATLGISYAGQLADSVQDHGIAGRLDWRF